MLKHAFTPLGIFIVALLHYSILYAQVSEPIRGKLIDDSSKEPVPFATVKLKSKPLGAISNNDGSFSIPFKYWEGGDTLLISCIGYATKIVPLKKLIPNEVNRINLSLSTAELSEVIIEASKEKNLSAHKVVKRAIQHIPDNYPYHPYRYNAYYRDYQLEERKYVNLNESLVEIYDWGFQKNDYLTTGLRVHSYRRNDDFKQDSILARPYDNASDKFVPGANIGSFGGNELSILRIHDAIRNHSTKTYSYVNTFSENFLGNHFFSFEKPVYLDEVPLYCISFKSKYFVTGSRHEAEGKIYIAYDDYAIHRLDYTTYEKGIGKNRKVLYDIKLEYSRIGELMYLNYISFNNVFNVTDPKNFKLMHIEIIPNATPAKNEVVLTFNNAVARESMEMLKNYKVTLAEKRLSVANASYKFTKDDKHVRLAFDEESNVEIAKAAKEGYLSRLMVEVKNLVDTKGYVINDEHLLIVNQFREMFVQHVYPMSDIPFDSLYMNKEVPLVKSPVTPESALATSYWMNTPLKAKVLK